MPLRELIRISLGALGAHKLRSFLTALGVVIAVWTIVSVVSVMVGMNNFVATKIFTLSPDVFAVTQFGIITSREEFLEAVKRKTISEHEIHRLAELCESCAEVGQTIEGTKAVHAGDRRLGDVEIRGTTANVARLQNLDIEAGRYFTESENQHREPVAIIGSEVREELYPRRDPIGRPIWVDGQPHRIIGVLAKQGNILGQNLDIVVYVPYRDAEKFLGKGRRLGEGQITALVRAAGGVPGVGRAKDEVIQVFRWLRATPIRGKDPVGVVTAEMIQTLWRGISATTYVVLFIISGISLVVGAIVVANIMLVSVVERTREIGVRMALGARKRDLRRQFLLEAAFLSIGGGILGTLAGAVTAWVVNTQSPFPALVSPGAVVMAITVSACAGIVAGFLPARQAASLQPVEALRHE
jgi:putative ABC transport system permease protein